MRVNGLGNNVGIGTTSNQLIPGASTKMLGAQWQAARVVSDGQNWFVV